ncbi:hypothetical protein LINPERHAP1_LOCUS278, partial [Linum perenne]
HITSSVESNTAFTSFKSLNKLGDHIGAFLNLTFTKLNYNNIIHSSCTRFIIITQHLSRLRFNRSAHISINMFSLHIFTTRNINPLGKLSVFSKPSKLSPNSRSPCQ